MLKYGNIIGGDDPNVLAAINAGRCAIVNFGEGGWYFLGSAYHFLKYFQQEQQLVDILAEYQPIICTCKKGLTLEALFGFSDPFASTETNADGAPKQNLLAEAVCSEAAANLKVKNEGKSTTKK